MTEKTKKELNRLYMSELITALVCGVLMYLLTDSTGQPLDLRLLIPGGVLIFIILQSAGYWYYRYQLLDAPRTPMDWVMPAFSVLKKLDLALFVLYPLYLLYLLIFQPNAFFMTMNIFGLILYAFSMIEYYNYYYFSVQIGVIKKKIPSELRLELSQYEKTKLI
ncbi:hypothetical protein [Acetobacterium sp.]|jgi:hypothetical protein|uniref:hypothetical protein n=1 Tax=Acetobacterium sp. TaxID=1872094 RepID=UPI0027243E47|nr:hypothetical protein [Acetobacterium sp.]MDO9492721.1 hypothetical protein [Acetobacterium sp.]